MILGCWAAKHSGTKVLALMGKWEKKRHWEKTKRKKEEETAHSVGAESKLVGQSGQFSQRDVMRGLITVWKNLFNPNNAWQQNLPRYFLAYPPFSPATNSGWNCILFTALKAFCNPVYAPRVTQCVRFYRRGVNANTSVTASVCSRPWNEEKIGVKKKWSL